MKLKSTIGAIAACVALVFGAAANAADVYCPGTGTGASPGTNSASAPSSGRYVFVTGGQADGLCAYAEGNLDKQVTVIPGPPPVKMPYYETLGLTLIDKNGLPGTFLTSGYPSGATSGNWSLWSEIWSHFDKLYLGFHFGEGSGNPDSFVVELADGTTSGRWVFNAIAPDSLNGLSNIYLFSNGPCTGDCDGRDVPEPGTLALLGAGLVGLSLIRRRRRA